MVSVEDGEILGGQISVFRESYPHVVAGLRLETGHTEIGTVIGFDPVNDELAAKIRFDFEMSDALSAFFMAGYRSRSGDPGYFGVWEGRYAAWAGFSFQASEKITFNSQAAYTDSGKFAIATSVDYSLLPALLVTGELALTSFPTKAEHREGALGAIISIERAF